MHVYRCTQYLSPGEFVYHLAIGVFRVGADGLAGCASSVDETLLVSKFGDGVLRRVLLCSKKDGSVVVGRSSVRCKFW